MGAGDHATWEEWGTRGRPAGTFRPGLRRQRRAVWEAVSEFAVWNYFTGPRHQPGRFYAEGKCPRSA